MNNFRSLLVAGVALATIAGFTLGGVSFHGSAAVDDSTAWSQGHDGSEANADKQGRKHGGEFSEDHNEQENEDEASSFVHHPPPDAEIKHRANTAWSHGRDGSEANADEHWRKHGGEFSEDHNEQEYEDEASSFVHHPPPEAEIKHRANGDTLIYDRNTNTFAVEDRHGNPRTMFKPDRGDAYWERQH